MVELARGAVALATVADVLVVVAMLASGTFGEVCLPYAAFEASSLAKHALIISTTSRLVSSMIYYFSLPVAHWEIAHEGKSSYHVGSKNDTSRISRICLSVKRAAID